MRKLLGITLEELDDFFSSIDVKPYRSRQVMSWLYRKGADSFEEMTDLPKELRCRLSGLLSIGGADVEKIESSHDGTRKILIGLEDGEAVEVVLIPAMGRLTLCISTQVGCGLGCSFCLTGKLGFKRNLLAHEIIGQYIAAHKIIDPDEKITNIVLMGMGEPLLNYQEVKKFIEIATSANGLNFPQRRITLSTAGLIDKMEILSRELRGINLAVSINATTDQQRTLLMPINKQYPLKDLLDLCRRYPLAKRRVINFEYVIIKGVNDSVVDSMRLAELLRGIKCKINLIPFNPIKLNKGVAASDFESPTGEVVLKFQEILMQARYLTFIRESKGNDISAACGQLRGIDKDF